MRIWQQQQQDLDISFMFFKAKYVNAGEESKEIQVQKSCNLILFLKVYLISYSLTSGVIIKLFANAWHFK